MIPTLEWLPTGVNFHDQTKLPLEETYVLATDYKQVAAVIRDLIVRGSPDIGVAGAMGVALGIQNSTAKDIPALNTEVAAICDTLAATRPTAVNLFWGIGRVRDLYNTLAAANTPIREIKSAVVDEARSMYDEDIDACKQMGAFGADLAQIRYRPHPLQCRRARHLRLRHCARRHPRRRRARPPD